jgi:glycerophosphocholine phosphodiesterase GPCPD1
MRQESIGHIRIEYVVIRPLPNCPCDLSVSYSKHWKGDWKGLDIGHRGSGNSQKKIQKCANIRENTIASLQQAAEHGADLVEFDVMLSKDLVPVLFHDFHVNIGLNQKAKQGGGLTTLRIPVKDLTLKQLHELKISHEHEEPTEDPLESDLVEPFPTLQLALENVSPFVGFNIEIKWTMQLTDGSFELDYPFELNMFLDIVLQTVLNYAGNRRIVFSSFNPDICFMIRLKQNKYPVLFLTQGATQKYPAYNDPRTQSTPAAINFALFSGILGLNMHTEDILRDPSLVEKARSHGLITFCWGDDNNSKATIKYLKELGLNGVIYDCIEEHMGEKQSIFLTDDGDDYLQIAAALSPSSPGILNEDSQENSNSPEEADVTNLSITNGRENRPPLDFRNLELFG